MANNTAAFSAFNKALFDNMSNLADAVWEIDLGSQSVKILEDKLTPEWREQVFALQEVRSRMNSLSEKGQQPLLVEHLDIASLKTLLNSISFKTKILVGEDYHTIQAVMTPSLDETGSVQRVYVTFLDIQKYLDAQEDNRKTRKELEMYLSSVSCGILQFALDSNEILYVNDNALKILGYKSVEQMQEDGFNGVAKTVVPEDAIRLHKLVENLKSMSKQEVVECEYRVIHKDGQEIDCFGTLRILEGENGQKILQRSMVDITEAKRNSRLYKEATEILSGAKMGLWFIILDEGENRCIADANVKELIGASGPMTEEEVFKFWFERIDKNDVAKVLDCAAAMRRGSHAEVKYTYHHPDRGPIVIRCGGINEPQYPGSGVMIHGYHQDITEFDVKLQEKELINASVAKIFDTMHLLNIVTGEFQEVGVSQNVKNIVDQHQDEHCQKVIWEVMRQRISADYFDAVKEFTTLSTLEERMQGKNGIQLDALNIDDKWYRFLFIRVNGKEEKMEKVIFASQDVDSTRRKEEQLITLSNTDNLTGLFNRHAYEENVVNIPEEEIGQDLWFIGLDINNLKITNDTLGHQAGDEIICGAADCLKLAFCNLGQVYRMGGDEFQVVLRGTEAEVCRALQSLEKYRKKWRGEYVDEFTISQGMVCSSELSHCTIAELSRTADERMYAEKKKFHRSLEQ